MSSRAPNALAPANVAHSQKLVLVAAILQEVVSRSREIFGQEK